MAQELPNQALQEPDPIRRPARLALYLGAAMIIAGGVVLYLGYDGAAKNPIPQAQTPYVISGGLLGLGLMALGGIAIAVYALLQVQGDLRADLNAMRGSIDKLVEVMAYQAFTPPIKATGVSTNGTVMVARGAGTFHKADCRLVARAESIAPLPREEADRSGLTPCRICKP